MKKLFTSIIVILSCLHISANDTAYYGYAIKLILKDNQEPKYRVMERSDSLIHFVSKSGNKTIHLGEPSKLGIGKIVLGKESSKGKDLKWRYQATIGLQECILETEVPMENFFKNVSIKENHIKPLYINKSNTIIIKTYEKGFGLTIYEIGIINYDPSKYPSSEQKIESGKEDVQQDVKKVFRPVDIMPKFQKGDTDLFYYLQANMKYPQDAIDKKIEGTVIAKFTIVRTGDISDIEIIRSLNPSCDEEAIRLINSMPKWKPGKSKGENVDVEYTLPIRFKINK